MTTKVPYLAYLKNLRESPNKRAAVQASPTQGIVTKPVKTDLAVYEKDQDELTNDLISQIRLDEETKMRLMENQRSNTALTTDDGTPISLDEANELMSRDVPSGGLMSPEIEGTELEDAEVSTEPSTKANYKQDENLAPYADTISILQDNSEFMTQIGKMTEKYPGLTEREIFMVAAKESSVGTDMGRLGNMFQIMGDPAREAGIDLQKLNKSDNMTDHLKALEKYLDRWDYDGKVPLGLVIAAPGKRNSDPSTVVYPKGSDEALANEGWQDANGDVTVGSIIKFYRG